MCWQQKPTANGTTRVHLRTHRVGCCRDANPSMRLRCVLHYVIRYTLATLYACQRRISGDSRGAVGDNGGGAGGGGGGVSVGGGVDVAGDGREDNATPPPEGERLPGDGASSTAPDHEQRISDDDRSSSRGPHRVHTFDGHDDPDMAEACCGQLRRKWTDSTNEIPHSQLEEGEVGISLSSESSHLPLLPQVSDSSGVGVADPLSSGYVCDGKTRGTSMKIDDGR
ncbi:hypothetical protein EVAR_12976_1 [Eumeta japonica]|uniref:Uncharacterized protein n=1 Tax=Eumeta variegata TaxID=151549 RepID=A0A4C1TWT5_EUMVA|nr:hypothetical protein EVAR_12976_1 [Eumeta japonica]